MTVKECVLDFATGEWGEDRLCAGEELSFVIDGATPISHLPYGAWHSNAEWMAETLKEHLQKGIPGGDFPRCCQDFAQTWRGQVQRDFPKVQEQPSLTVAAVHKRNGKVRGYVLGDCAIYVQTETGLVHCLSDRRTETFYQRTLAAREKAAAAGANVEQAVTAQRIRNKATMNQPGGYWTVACVGDFRREFYRFELNESNVRSILLCTDGFDRLFVKKMLKPEQVLQGEYPLEKAMRLLREKEKNMSQDVKLHDDAAAILLSR